VVNEARLKKKTDQGSGNERLNRQKAAGNRKKRGRQNDRQDTANEATTPCYLETANTQRLSDIGSGQASREKSDPRTPARDSRMSVCLPL
jgi:hypothetical protein